MLHKYLAIKNISNKIPSSEELGPVNRVQQLENINSYDVDIRW
jgi:hypothetical protein